MLRPARRVRRQSEFDTVFRGGRPVHGQLMSVRAVEAVGPTAFGFVVGSRVSRTAVGRNRLKRQLRAIVMDQLDDIAADRKVVITAKPPAAGSSTEELTAELTSLLKRATLIR